MKTEQWVYAFEDVATVEARAGDWEGVRGLLGGKGANLAEMTRLGLPVPPGFTITTHACMATIHAGFEFPEGLWGQALSALAEMERRTGKRFGAPENPLLVSVRSGASYSMPGMMETILNVGLNDAVVPGLVALTGNARFVWDSYRRLLAMFGHTAMGIEDEVFKGALEVLKCELGATQDTDLDAEAMRELTARFKQIYRNAVGEEFPQAPEEQLRIAIGAIFRSWMGKRASDYRRIVHIADDIGTGVNVQAMVFGNMGWNSGTGVGFTRDSATGERTLYGDYLLNAQGEDVVAGIRNTKRVAALGDDLPEIGAQLRAIGQQLEAHYRDMQDIEFTIERGKLWILQTRTGKRSARAAVKIAADMVAEGMITREQALLRVTPQDVEYFLHPQFVAEEVDAAEKAGRLIAEGVAASPGAAVGRLVFDADTAEARGTAGEAVIMVRAETKPDDVHGMKPAQGILTSLGGTTAHAAVVARQFGIPAVVGAAALRIDEARRQVMVNGRTLGEVDVLSLDGATGKVFAGALPMVVPDFGGESELLTLLGWADEMAEASAARQWEAHLEGFPTRGLQVWANADLPEDARRARRYGARGIGLCRSEHMFFHLERLPHVQTMILHAEEAQSLLDAVLDCEQILESGKERGQVITEKRRGEVVTALAAAQAAVAASEAVRVYRAALARLEEFQYSDFYGLFEAMDGLPVVIRLLDPPMHEFLPEHDELVAKVAELRARGDGGAELEQVETQLDAIKRMHEANPMMGLRGIRLGIVFPDIVEMQVRAIFAAACDAAAAGHTIYPEVMIPLTGHVNELKWTQLALERVAKAVMAEKGRTLVYKFGTMLEVPRACLTAGALAGLAEFFSFGTNDLTQMTFGYSRDDAERRFLHSYIERGILSADPFQTLDPDGVGELVRTGVRRGRVIRPGLEVGVCGEHGGDPQSVEFCHLAGLNYVSCSPFRVPVARLAAAQAALKYRGKVLD